MGYLEYFCIVVGNLEAKYTNQKVFSSSLDTEAITACTCMWKRRLLYLALSCIFLKKQYNYYKVQQWYGIPEWLGGCGECGGTGHGNGGTAMQRDMGQYTAKVLLND